MKTCKNTSCNKDISNLHPLKKYCSDSCRDIGYKNTPEFQDKEREYQRAYKRKYYDKYLKSKRAK